MDNYLLFETALEQYNKVILSLEPDFDSIKSIPSTSTIDSICSHEDVAYENNVTLCLECGVEVSKDVFLGNEYKYLSNDDTRRIDPHRINNKKLDDKNIFKDVEHMNFNEPIILQANKMYVQVTNFQTYRGKTRKAIIFACIYYSFKLNNITQSYDSLLKMFDISRKISLKGLKFVKLNTTKENNIHGTQLTVENIIIDIMNKFNSNEKQQNEVIELYTKIKNKSSKINRSRPASIGSSVIYYWLSKKNNIHISLKDFSDKVDLSELTISKIIKEIDTIYKNL